MSIAPIRLDDRIVIVTGASRGLGRAMALGLADAGARLVLASPDEAGLGAVVEEIEAKHGGGRALAVRADITREADCAAIVAATLKKFGALHGLVNNARRLHRGPGLPADGNSLRFWESDPEIWRETIRVNIAGTYLMTRAAVPPMLEQGWGRIVNLTTSLATMQRGRNSPYGVTKAALEAATLIWAQDLAGTGITVNSLLPGGACDSDPERPARPGRALLPVEIMNPAVIWLVSTRSEGKTGGRYVGIRWDDRLSPEAAAAAALDPSVLRHPVD